MLEIQVWCYDQTQWVTLPGSYDDVQDAITHAGDVEAVHDRAIALGCTPGAVRVALSAGAVICRAPELHHDPNSAHVADCPAAQGVTRDVGSGPARRPSAAQARVIRQFNGDVHAHDGHRPPTQVTYAVCVRHGWIEQIDAWPYHRTTAAGAAAIGVRLCTGGCVYGTHVADCPAGSR